MASLVVSTPAAIKRKVLRTFNTSGLNLTPDASKYMVEQIAFLEEAATQKKRMFRPEAFILEMIDKLKSRHLTTTVVDLESVKTTMSVWTQDGNSAQNNIQAMSAFKAPHIKFDQSRKQYYKATQRDDRGHLFAPADAKPEMFRQRYHTLHQRLMRKAFAQPGSDGADITTVESLMGSERRTAILGKLSNPSPNNYFIEDLTGRVPLMFADDGVYVSHGIFCDGVIVVSEGYYKDGVFTAASMLMVPPECRRDTLSVHSNVDHTGLMVPVQEYNELKTLEKENSDAMIVVLSDCHLDNPARVDALQNILRTYDEENVPDMIVLMGNFLSAPVGDGLDSYEAAIECFEALASFLNTVPNIRDQSEWVFVPGPNDPGVGNSLPQPSLPKSIEKTIKDVLPRAVMGTNPCRVRFYTQDLLFFRNNLLSKFRASMRNWQAVKPIITDDVTILDHLAHTLMSQAHLCPLSPLQQPIFWSYDGALRLNPLPDVLVMADDGSDRHSAIRDGTTVVNPGSFGEAQEFIVLWPFREDNEDDDMVEYSEVPME